MISKMLKTCASMVSVFYDAQLAFYDPKRVIAIDIKHSTKNEKRYFCFGEINDNILTVRFTIRSDNIRIIGAGY